jgi:hypothetical protein
MPESHGNRLAKSQRKKGKGKLVKTWDEVVIKNKRSMTKQAQTVVGQSALRQMRQRQLRQCTMPQHHSFRDRAIFCPVVAASLRASAALFDVVMPGGCILTVQQAVRQSLAGHWLIQSRNSPARPMFGSRCSKSMDMLVHGIKSWFVHCWCIKRLQRGHQCRSLSSFTLVRFATIPCHGDPWLGEIDSLNLMKSSFFMSMGLTTQ